MPSTVVNCTWLYSTEKLLFQSWKHCDKGYVLNGSAVLWEDATKTILGKIYRRGMNIKVKILRITNIYKQTTNQPTLPTTTIRMFVTNNTIVASYQLVINNVDFRLVLKGNAFLGRP